MKKQESGKQSKPQPRKAAKAKAKPKLQAARQKRKSAAEILRESEKRFRALIENGLDNISLLAADGTLLWESPAAIHMLGYAPNEFVGGNIFELVHPDDLDRIRNQFAELVREPASHQRDSFRLRHMDGTWRWVEAIGTNLLTEPSVKAIVINYRDITERRQAEKALRESEEKYRTVLENVDEIVYQLKGNDPFRNIVEFVSPRTESFLGYKPDEFAQDATLWSCLLHPDDLPVIEKQTLAILSSKKPGTREYRMRHKTSGEYRWMEDRMTPQCDAAGQIVGIFGVARDITERRQAEAERTQLLNILEASLNEIYIFDTKTLRFQYVNVGALRNLGYSRAALETMTPLDIKPEFDEVSFRNLLEPLLNREKEQLIFQTVHRRADASLYPVEVHLQLVEQHATKVFLAIILDITERKRAEEELRASEARLVEAQHSAHIGNWEQDLESDRLLGSEEAYRIIGVSSQEFVGTTEAFAQLVHPDDRKLFNESVTTAVREKKANEVDYRILRPDGAQRIIHVVVEAEFDDAGRATRLFGTLQDITERKQSEEALRESEAKFKGFLDSVPDAMIIVNKERQIILSNAQMKKMFDYTQEELLGKTIEFLIPERLRNKHQVHHAGFFADPHARAMGAGLNLYALRKDGSEFPVEVSLNYHKTGDEVIAINTIRDITERKKAEAELKKLSSAVEQTADPVFITDRNGVIEYVNTAFEKVSGFAKEELLGKTPRIVKSDKHPREFYKNLWQTILSGKVYNAEFINRKKNGELYYVVKNITPIRDAQGKITHFVSTGIDITERKRAEEKIQQQLQRITALRKIDLAITSNFDLKVTLNTVIEGVIRQLQVDAAVVLLTRAELNEMELVAGQGLRNNIKTYPRLKLGEGFAGKALIERRIVVETDLTKKENFFSKSNLEIDEGFVTLYAVPLIIKGKVKGVLEVLHRSKLEPDPEWLSFLETLGGQAAIAIDSTELFTSLQRSVIDLRLAYDATIEGWSHALDLRDKETEGHTKRVTQMTMNLAVKMGMSDAELVQVKRGALLHDMGKLGVPDPILLKPDALTDDEWVLMRKHPQYAYDMLSPIAFLRPALDIPYCHHEKWDGTGYPNGIKGEAIPLAARIFSIVDVWDALRSDRPYRPAWTKEKTIEYIKSLAGIHFDPKVVNAFLEMIREDKTQ